MTILTCRNIVRRALRKLSRVAAGAEPDGDDLDDAMETLQSIYMELLGHGVFGRLYDVVVTTTPYTASPQQRVNCRRIGGVIVTLPDLIDPAILCLGNGCYDYGFRDYYCGTTPPQPHDEACIQVNDAFSATAETFIYIAKTARWIKLEAIAPATEAPLSDRYADTLASILAARIAPEYGMQTPPQIAQDAMRGVYALTHRYDSARTTQYDPARYF